MKSLLPHFTTILLLCLAFSSCSDIAYDDYSSSEMADGKIKLVVNYNIPQSQILTTRTMQALEERENNIKNAVLLIFEASNKDRQLNTDRLVQIAKTTIDPASTDPINFIVAAYKGNCRVKILANVSNSCLATIDTYTTTTNSSAPTTIADFKKLKSDIDVLRDPKIGDYLPLCAAEPTVYAGINAQTDISVQLKRIYSRIEVELAETITDFTIHKAHIVSLVQNGRFEPYDNEIFIKPDLETLGKVEVISKDGRTTPPVYLYEHLDNVASSITPTSIILEATYHHNGNNQVGFYKFDIEYHTPDNEYCYEIRRNIRYKGIINKVKHFGYLTYEDALVGHAENVEFNYDVVIDDLDATHDILHHSSGFSISTTNSEVEVQAISPQTEFIATSLRFDLSQFTYSEPSRTIRVIKGADKLRILNEAEVLNAPLKTVVDLKVIATEPDVMGEIEIRYGGLRKIIKVNTKKMLRSDSQQSVRIDNALSLRFDKANDSQNWLRASSNLTYPTTFIDNFTYNSPQTVYCIAPQNTAETRQSVVYVYRDGGVGTLKVIVSQTYGLSYVNNTYYRETRSLTDNAHKQKRANSLLIPTKQGLIYHLTGNRIRDYYGIAGPNINIVNPKAEIIWSDFKYKDPNPFEPHDLIEVNNPDGDIEKITLNVRNYHEGCGNNGNGSIIWGIKNGDGQWLWSWHLWLTDMVEENNNNINYTGYEYGYILDKIENIKLIFELENSVSAKCLKTWPNDGMRVYLDRNIGAKTSGYQNNASNVINAGKIHYGFYYQYGRKDPFPSNDGILNAQESKIYTPDHMEGINFNDILVNERSYTLLESIQQPTSFFATGGVDWCPQNILENNWGNSYNGKTKKTIYDLSPYGWRLNWGNGKDALPPQSPNNELQWHFYSNNSRHGIASINKNFYFSAGGYRDNTSGKIVIEDCGYYWSGNCFIYGNIYGYTLSLKAKGAGNNIVESNINEKTSSCGAFIRPVLDN